jgi:parvulin-like peptidyl-prolyl isomerase
MQRIAPSLATLLLSLALGAAGCQRDLATTGSNGSAGSTVAVGSGSAAGSADEPTPSRDLDSKDILARAETAPLVQVKHVLIGWKELGEVLGERLDPRAAERTNAQAADLALEVAAKLKAAPGDLDKIVKEYSEDPGSLVDTEGYTIAANSGMVPEFEKLALRLQLGEIGIVQTLFGYHVMVRVPPPPLDPLESAEVLARPLVAPTGELHFQHVLLRWKDSPLADKVPLEDAAKDRTKAQADELAKTVLAKALGGADMAALMKEYSEDPTTRESGDSIPLPPDVPAGNKLPDLVYRLKDGEIGVVKSDFGWHVVKRVPPPPPDALQSLDILARQPVTTQATVKHVLLGWKGVNTGDARAEARDRKTLEALVKKTVARLKKGEPIDAVMKELSEDPGSAESGGDYDVTPDARLVPPFKDLSLRLNVGEIGVVRTDYGMHIIMRMPDKAAAAPAAGSGSGGAGGSAASTPTPSTGSGSATK